jgi:hypothetical protein
MENGVERGYWRSRTMPEKASDVGPTVEKIALPHGRRASQRTECCYSSLLLLLLPLANFRRALYLPV